MRVGRKLSLHEMTLTDTLKVGDLVWYQPRPGDRKYAAVVGGSVGMLGGTPVVRLVDVEYAYTEDCHPNGPIRTHVPAAALFAICRREAEKDAP